VNIYLTFDYELFFGENTGTVQDCLINPTAQLFSFAKQKDVHYTFFVDVGFLIAAEKYPELNNDLNLVKNQVNEMVALGHDVQLHIHPHWEKATWDKVWSMNINESYKLSDFPQDELVAIVRKYKTYLDELIGKETFVFRAGGWCIQPFSLLKNVFLELGITIDSTVFPGGYLQTKDYDVNFLKAPKKSKYQFENDVCEEVENGSFTEYSIASYRYFPSFYWWLYGLGRIFPKRHKMLGKGNFISQGGRKWSALTSFSDYHVSTDGYFAKKLEASLQKAINLEHEEFVTIGHPKSCSVYSLIKTKQFIDKYHLVHHFKTFDRN